MIHICYTHPRCIMGLTVHHFFIGTDAYPPTKIKRTGLGYCEPFEELKRSFNCAGSAL